MSQGSDLDRLAVRTLLTDKVVGYAMALDTRDWTAFRALFTDEVAIDYASLRSLCETVPAQVWVDRCRVLGGFDATQHKVCNFVVMIEADVASVTSYVDAAHFIRRDGRDLAAFACGTYLHTFARQPDGEWKMTGCKFTVAGYATGRAAFDEAFAAARAAYAEAA